MERWRKTFSKFSFIVLVSGALFAQADCEKVLSRVSSLSKWSIQDQNLKLSARDLFPEDYVKQVEADRGPLRIEVRHVPERGYVAISGSVKSKTYVRVKLIQDKRHAESLIVDELNLQDPLKDDQRDNLNPDQTGKGLPLNVFRHVKEQLFEIAKAGGYSDIRTHSQQHYAVVMLYRRMVGMEPADEKSKKTLDYLDSLYSFARKELPEALRPADIEEFTKWLGTAGLDPAGVTLGRARLLEKYLETGKEDPSFTILKNKEGQAIAALFNDNDQAKSKIVFFDLTEEKPTILHWYGLAFSHRLELIKKF